MVPGPVRTEGPCRFRLCELPVLRASRADLTVSAVLKLGNLKGRDRVDHGQIVGEIDYKIEVWQNGASRRASGAVTGGDPHAIAAAFNTGIPFFASKTAAPFAASSLTSATRCANRHRSESDWSIIKCDSAGEEKRALGQGLDGVP